jgi:HD-GYP domain-containing protein (c-di-GMP phosphodiesterase class II)
VVESQRGDALRSARAYLGFLHDRLAASVPGIRSVTLCHAAADAALQPVLVASRDADSDGGYELTCSARADMPGHDADLTVLVVHRGQPEAAVVFDVPADLVVAREVQRHLELYATFSIAGIRLDVGEQWWRDLTPGAQTFERRDPWQSAHVERVGGYCQVILRALAEPLGLAPDFIDAVVRYAPLHDIGQVALSDDIMRKPGRLDPEEWTLMQSHTTRGRMIVDQVVDDATADAYPRPDVLRSIVELHHETLDGAGYPHGLGADDIPLEVRIVTVADIFDALTSERPYKPGWTADESLAEMDRMVAADKLDGRCLTALVTQPAVVESVVGAAAQGMAAS